MKTIELFIALFLLNLLHTTFIHLQLTQPFLPLDWEYTAGGVCSVGCSVSEMFIEIFCFTTIMMIVLLIVEFVLAKMGIKNLYRIGILAIIYGYSYYWLTHLEESFCEITQMYNAYMSLYGIGFLVAYGLLYWFSNKE